MGSGNQTQSIMMVEFIDHPPSKKPTHSSRILRPAIDILRIRPHQISKWTLCRYFLHSIQLSDLVDGVDIGGKPTMHTENVVCITEDILSITAESGKKSKV